MPEPAGYEPNHVKRWIVYRLAATSPGNANNNYRALSARFNWLLAEEEIEHHPTARMNPPHVPDQPIPIILVQFIKQVLRDCQSRDFHSRRDEAIIQLVWDTGGCLSEIANIDLSRRVVNVLGKGSKWRAHPLQRRHRQSPRPLPPRQSTSALRRHHHQTVAQRPPPQHSTLAERHQDHAPPTSGPSLRRESPLPGQIRGNKREPAANPF
ncbi:hypothetical protein [Amycolatopsis circi]|uniref:hypothetical protein n=1 Tax=Amycolatopsis circi TaxID=871959 RepID=UPI000E23D53D|nr:hypothetical protein [Amycolatopsis circi]